MTRDGGQSGEDHGWDMMVKVYAARQVDVNSVTTVGQGLITAVTLSAALGAPLLIIGTEWSVANAFFGLGLLVYLGVLWRALSQAFRVLYSRIDETAPASKHTGLMNWRWVSSNSPASYEEHIRMLDHESRLRSIIHQDWLAANLVADKARRVKSTVLWASASLIILGLLTIARFLIIFIG